MDHQKVRSELQVLNNITLIVEEFMLFPSLSTKLALEILGELGDLSEEFGGYTPRLRYIIAFAVKFWININFIWVYFPYKYRFIE